MFLKKKLVKLGLLREEVFTNAFCESVIREYFPSVSPDEIKKLHNAIDLTNRKLDVLAKHLGVVLIYRYPEKKLPWYEVKKILNQPKGRNK